MSNLIVKMHRRRSKHKCVSEITDQDTSDSDYDVFQDVIDHEFEEELKGLPEVLKYINHLLTLINRQQVKLDKVCMKVKKLKKRIKRNKITTHITDTSTQTEDLSIAPPSVTIKHEPKSKPEPEPECEPEPSSLEPTDAWADQSTGLSLAEQVKQAAQSAMQNTSFVYEPTSGMYYDYNTNYYYNAEMGLYYDGNTGTYLYYDEATQTYVFHSQAEVTPSDGQTVEEVVEPVERKKKVAKRKKEVKVEKVDKDGGVESPEEGECSDSSGSDETLPETPEHPAEVWPPCMRVIVKETGVEGLKVGTLFIVTITGGTMGREGDHAILIPDINISKHHARFSYDETEGKYCVADFGSRNGTYLNAKRLSVAKQESEPCEIVHGSTLIVGSTTMTCHIHPGTETCGHCEPGLIQVPEVPETRRPSFPTGGKTYKSELRRLRKKFGLASTEPSPTAVPEGYEDRAQVRRATVGSSHDHNEKTRSASVHEAIAEDNKGFKMLAKMGWSKGQALGKDGDGLIEPVLQEQRDGKAGLGSTLPTTRVKPAIHDVRKTAVWKKTQERYQQISNLPCGDMFKEDLDTEVTARPAPQRVRAAPTEGKRKEGFTPPASPPEAPSVDERKNLVWRKTQHRLKKTQKRDGTVATPPTSPPREDDQEAA